MLKIKLSNISEKFLKKCDDSIYQRIIKKIKELAKNPFPSDSLRVANRKEKVFRIRVGNYRIIYAVFIERDIIFISEINKRSKIYD